MLKISSEIHTVRSWVDISYSMQLFTSDLRDNRRALCLRDGIEIPINQRIRVSLPTDASEPTVEESCVLQHLPHGRVTPIIWNRLWENLDFEVVMPSGKHSGRCEKFFYIQANKVLPSFLECVFEGLLVLLGFSLSVRNKAVTVSYENKHSP